jgi:ABC-2 type transport system ATP-binding protein
VPADPAIAIDALVVHRGGRPVLHGISCAVRPGTVTGLLGPSGSGKSTLIRAVVGVQIVQSGRVSVLGAPAGSAALRARVGYVTQAPSVYADLSVRENLRYFARVLGVGESRIDAVIAAVSLRDHADHVVSRLSGGEQARVSLATALLGEPEVLVLDEPTVGLDPLLRRDLWTQFTELARSGVALLVSSHVMDEAERCEELLLLREGALLATTTPGELRERTGQQDLGDAFLALIEEQAGS